MRTCLITGGAGFIGSHLCSSLIKTNKFIFIDNLLTGRRDNIAKLERQENFEFIEADATNKETYKQLEGKQIDYIFHLASPASPNKNSKISYLAHPLKTMLVNSIGTYYLLKLAKLKRADFLFASTSEIYGDPKQHPQKETYWGNVNPNGIRSCYDESKRYGEAMTMIFVRNFNVNARIVRIFNTYGPNMSPEDGRAMVNFIIQAVKGEPFTIYGKGTQTRSFCYVSDLVAGIEKAMFVDGTRGEVFNLGNLEEHTMNELVNIIAKKLNIDKKIKYLPLPDDDPTRRRPDISKANEVLNWFPKLKLDKGLDKTIEYFKYILPRKN